jgi:hypothetical protein
LESKPAVSRSVAVARTAERTWAGVLVGKAWRKRARTPDTYGAAIDVPLIEA